MIHLRRFGIALSLANFVYLRFWSELLTYTGSDSFFMAAPPPPQKYAALVVNVTILTLVLFAATTIMHYRRGAVAKIGRWVFLIALLLPLNALREILSRRYGFLRAEAFRYAKPTVIAVLLLISAVVLLYLMSRWEHRLVRLASQGLLICTPLALMNFGQAFYAMTHYEPRPFANRCCAAPLPLRAGQPRVVILLFDEWDYRLTFDDRPRSLQMPEVDRLRREALFATHARTPSTATIVSIPSMWLGRQLAETYPGGVSEMIVRFKNDPTLFNFSDFPNMFSDARAAGFNTGAIGWYLPYCRILGSNLTYCTWVEMLRQHNATGTSFAENLVNQNRSLLETSLFSVFGQSLVIRGRIRNYHTFMEAAATEVADPNLGLLFVHFGIPHPPYFYNRHTGNFDMQNSAVRGYFDNLALTDRSIGVLRRQMEASSLWDRSTILVLSDHAFRTAAAIDGKIDRRAPFLLKMAGSHEAFDFDTPFSTLLLRDLVRDILQRKVVSSQDAGKWIQARAAAPKPD